MPYTTNIGLNIPNTGDMVGTWGSGAVNPNMSSLDGYFGGVQGVTLGASPVTLTSPVGPVITPSAGPTQAENRVLRFSGALTANVVVTLPLPGSYIVENLTTGNFTVTFRGVTATEVIAVQQGARTSIFNDGSRVRFANLPGPGVIEVWAGLSAIPAWVTACTSLPYLLCDGSVYNFSDYPWLGARLLGSFGGNGVTTFAVPDLRGRVPLPYDGTGTRITTAGSGINGQALGSAGGSQLTTMARSDLPQVSIAVAITDPGHNHTAHSSQTSYSNGGNSFYRFNPADTAIPGTTYGLVSAQTGITAAFDLNGNVTQTNQVNVPPAQVTGIMVIKT